MIERFKRQPSKLTRQIDKLLEDMSVYPPDSPEYHAAITHLDKLMEIEREERKIRVSPDTWVLAGANFLGILVIVMYEQKHVVTSKAMTMLNRSHLN